LAKNLAEVIVLLPSHSYMGMANALSAIYATISRPPVLTSEYASSPTSKVGCVYSNLMKVALWLNNQQEANKNWCKSKLDRQQLLCWYVTSHINVKLCTML